MFFLQYNIRQVLLSFMNVTLVTLLLAFGIIKIQFYLSYNFFSINIIIKKQYLHLIIIFLYLKKIF